MLKVEGDGMIPARVAKELRSSRTWTSNWLARYRNGVLMDWRVDLRAVDLLNYPKELLLG
ncbi:MAG: hypothetical protein ACRD8Z_21340 [Nitrososphaeraceae archaeon]